MNLTTSLVFRHGSPQHIPAANLIESPPDPADGIGVPREVMPNNLDGAYDNLDTPTWQRRGMRSIQPAQSQQMLVWTHEAPTTPGSWWCRLTAFPDIVTLVHLVDSPNGLVVLGEGGRLARTAPCEWAAPRLKA